MNSYQVERDFVRMGLIALMAAAIFIGIVMYSTYGPVHTTYGPINVDGPEPTKATEPQ